MNLSTSLLVIVILLTATLSHANADGVVTITNASTPSTSEIPTAVELKIKFDSVCDPLSYNGLYLKHQLSLPLRIEPSSAPEFQLLGVFGIAEDALLSPDSFVQVMVQRSRQTGRAELIFLCPTFSRCQQLKEAIESSPEALWRSVQFTVTGRVGGQTILFEALRADNLPSFACDPGRWVVFQRRQDGNLSFVQNWDAYVNGFGSPDSNYWMGLDRLFRATATGSKSDYPDTSRCRLRVELQDFNGRSYWGEYKMFQVLDAGQNYLLRLGQEVAGSQLEKFVEIHSEMPFSTFDRDNDKRIGESCSQMFGYGGWWYKACHTVSLNGAYLADKNITDSPIYASFVFKGAYVPVRSSVMMFRCG